jgi:protein-tyrosine phosphatase
LVDIHSHILPGLDDGARTLEDSVAMLRLAAESGTTDIVATPHANPEFGFDPDTVAQKIAEVQSAAGPRPRIHCGCDFHLMVENIQDAVLNPAKYAINHRSYLLVEFSDMLIPATTREIFYRLQAAGLTPIITHPERNWLLHSRMDQLRAWVEDGALVQVTGQSLLGTFGRAAKSVAYDLMDRNLVHFIASDAHDTTYRPPMLDKAYAKVSKMWGRERAEMLFVISPGAVLEGDPVSAPPPFSARARRKWYRFGF